MPITLFRDLTANIPIFKEIPLPAFSSPQMRSSMISAPKKDSFADVLRASCPPKRSKSSIDQTPRTRKSSTPDKKSNALKRLIIQSYQEKIKNLQSSLTESTVEI